MPVFDQLHLAIEAIDVRSIGAGGGSIASVDENGELHVGPKSAGSDPGPACYGRGGTEPTVTDADLLLGRIDSGAIFGGAIHLDTVAAEQAMRPLANRLGMDIPMSCNAIVQIADAKMADLVRKVTIERGLDPRDFVVVGYGGAAPLHIGGYGPDIGAREAVLPSLAPVFSAFGLARADYQRVYQRSLPMRLPDSSSMAIVRALLAEMEDEARVDLAGARFLESSTLHTKVDLRYRRQTHELSIPFVSSDSVDEASIAALCSTFEKRYEEAFGRGAGDSAAGIEATTFSVVAVGKRSIPSGPIARRRRRRATRKPATTRSAYFNGWVKTPVYEFDALQPGDSIRGPILIDGKSTTLVVHPGQAISIDRLGNVRVTFR
jgi:N-methylhydantoinase A